MVTTYYYTVAAPATSYLVPNLGCHCTSKAALLSTAAVRLGLRSSLFAFGKQSAHLLLVLHITLASKHFEGISSLYGVSSQLILHQRQIEDIKLLPLLRQ